MRLSAARGVSGPARTSLGVPKYFQNCRLGFHRFAGFFRCFHSPSRGVPEYLACFVTVSIRTSQARRMKTPNYTVTRGVFGIPSLETPVILKPKGPKYFFIFGGGGRVLLNG